MKTTTYLLVAAIFKLLNERGYEENKLTRMAEKCQSADDVILIQRVGSRYRLTTSNIDNTALNSVDFQRPIEDD